MPFKIEEKTKGFLEYRDMDTEKMYDLLMNVYRWGRMDQPDVLLDYHVTYLYLVQQAIRYMYTRVANGLVLAGEEEKALEVLDRGMEVMHRYPLHYVVQPSYNEVGVMQAVELYYFLGQPEARALAVEFLDKRLKLLNTFCNRTRADFFLQMQNLPSVRTCM